MQQHDVACKAPGLAKVVRRHHDLDAACAHRAHDVFDRFGCRGIKAGSRLIQKQDRGVACQGAGERQPLLFAAGQPSRRPAIKAGEADFREKCHAALMPAVAGHAGGRQGVTDIAGRAAPEHGRPLKHDRALAGM